MPHNNKIAYNYHRQSLKNRRRLNPGTLFAAQPSPAHLALLGVPQAAKEIKADRGAGWWSLHLVNVPVELLEVQPLGILLC